MLLQLYGWYGLFVAIGLFVTWHRVEPWLYELRDRLTSPPPVNADAAAVNAARARQQQKLLIETKQKRDEREAKKRDEVLGRTKKPLKAQGFAPSDDLFMGRPGGGSTYRAPRKGPTRGGGGG